MGKHTLMLILLLILTLPAALPGAGADLAGGDHTLVDGYLVDFGYDPAEIRDTALLAFTLFQQDSIVPTTSAWIRISDTTAVVFAGTIHPTLNQYSFTYTFPHPGEYEVTVRFFDENKVVVETKFTMGVDDSATALFDVIVLSVIALIFIVVLCVVLFFVVSPAFRRRLSKRLERFKS